jgi:hypothetical protein
MEKDNKEPLTKAKRIITFLALIAAGDLSPWFLPLFGLNLFPEYFSPLPGVVGSIVFLLAFGVSLGLYRRTSRKRMQTFVLGSVVACVASIIGCFIMSQGFSHHWDLDAEWEPAVYALWLTVYGVVFVSLGSSLVLAGFLYLGNDAGK